MKLTNPPLSWSKSGHPYSKTFGDIYFSEADPVGESHHVFIDGNDLHNRFKECKNNQITIGEIGFGSGLNFLLTWQLWNKIKPFQGRLHYIAFEKYPLDNDSHQRILKLWPELQAFSYQLFNSLPAACCGSHRIILQETVILDLHYGDATQRIKKLERRNGIDAWFLDGFKPKNNTELWEKIFLTELVRLSRNSATLASYSVAGNFCRALKELGFKIEKRAGFKHKRHALSGTLNKSINNKQSSISQVWNKIPISHSRSKNRGTAIIGSGIAGCSAAYSLHCRGIKTTIFEAGNRVADNVTNIPQFVLRPRLFQAQSTEAEFFFQSYLFALRQLSQLSQVSNFSWEQCGVIQLQKALNKKLALDPNRVKKLYPDSEIKSAKDATDSQLIDPDQNNGFFFPKAGCVVPANLCRTLLELSQSEPLLNRAIIKLRRLNDEWLLWDSKGDIYSYEHVVLANSQSITLFAQCNDIPIKTITGQTSIVNGSASSAKQRSIISGARTVFPNSDGKNVNHLIAASYRDNSDLSSSCKDDQNNLELAKQLFTRADYLGDMINCSYTARRSNTPDRMPLVGALPNTPKIRQNFKELGKNAKKEYIDTEPRENYWPGLYISAAHGSNGLTTSGLSGEIITSLILNEQLPVNQNILDELNPVRFIIRALKKQQG